MIIIIFSMAIELTARQIRQAAADADLDERTVQRWLLGLPIRPGCQERLAVALAAQGIEVEIPRYATMVSAFPDAVKGAGQPITTERKNP
jgi:hypothetical protein